MKKAWKDGGERKPPFQDTGESSSAACGEALQSLRRKRQLVLTAIAERPVVQARDGAAGLGPVARASQTVELLTDRLAILGGRFGEGDAGAAEQRVVAQGVKRDGRARFQVAAVGLQAEHLLRFQVD